MFAIFVSATLTAPPGLRARTLLAPELDSVVYAREQWLTYERLVDRGGIEYLTSRASLNAMMYLDAGDELKVANNVADGGF